MILSCPGSLTIWRCGPTSKFAIGARNLITRPCAVESEPPRRRLAAEARSVGDFTLFGRQTHPSQSGEADRPASVQGRVARRRAIPPPVGAASPARPTTLSLASSCAWDPSGGGAHRRHRNRTPFHGRRRALDACDERLESYYQILIGGPICSRCRRSPNCDMARQLDDREVAGLPEPSRPEMDRSLIPPVTTSMFLSHSRPRSSACHDRLSSQRHRRRDAREGGATPTRRSIDLMAKTQTVDQSHRPRRRQYAGKQ
jgi:hypothetical protein